MKILLLSLLAITLLSCSKNSNPSSPGNNGNNDTVNQNVQAFFSFQDGSVWRVDSARINGHAITFYSHNTGIPVMSIYLPETSAGLYSLPDEEIGPGQWLVTDTLYAEMTGISACGEARPPQYAYTGYIRTTSNGLLHGNCQLTWTWDFNCGAGQETYTLTGNW